MHATATRAGGREAHLPQEATALLLRHDAAEDDEAVALEGLALVWLQRHRRRLRHLVRLAAVPPAARSHDGGGLGYGNTNREQLDSILRVGAASGVVLDHVYTGKALAVFCEHARAHPDQFRGKRILFWHTGGLPGLHAREAELLELMPLPERLVYEPK